MPRAPLMLTAAPLALAVALALTAAPARAQSARAIITAADIEAATFSGLGELPPGQLHCMSQAASFVGFKDVEGRAHQATSSLIRAISSSSRGGLTM